MTKYPKRVLTGAMIDHARGLLGDLCRAWEGALLECSGEADHLHALIDMPPKVRPSDLVSRRPHPQADACDD